MIKCRLRDKLYKYIYGKRVVMLKIKKTLYIFLLMFAFTVLFACTKTISVNNIAFSESIIEMTVGETYNPNVVIIPRNATLRNYTLVSSDSACFDGK